MHPFTLLTTAVFLFPSSLATPVSSDSRIRLRQADVLDVPNRVPLQATPTVLAGIAAATTSIQDPKAPYAAALQKHGFITMGHLKRGAAPTSVPDALARLDRIAQPEPTTTSPEPSNVRTIDYLLQSLLKWPSARKRTTPEIQPSAQKVTRDAPVNSTVPISQQIEGATGAGVINVKTAAFSGRHSFIKYPG